MRGLDRNKLDSNYINPQIETKSVILICPKVATKNILKKPLSKAATQKRLSFDSTYYSARIIAKQSIAKTKKKTSGVGLYNDVL